MSTNPWGDFKADVCKSLELAITKLGWKSPVPIETTLAEPPDQKLGDLASTLCFELAKSLHKSPMWIAAEISNEIKPTGIVSKVEVAGQYLNFFVDMPKLTGLTLQAINQTDDDYGRMKTKKEKVVIEHTSVNPTKPLHIGHGRNAVLGDTMARILRTTGHEVEVQNYIDDMGRQVAETLLAYGFVKKKPKAKFDHTLGLIYADMHRQLENKPELEEKVKKILVELEKGKGKRVVTAKKLSERCVGANLETTARLGINYDLLVWESDIVRTGLLEETLRKLRTAGRLVEGSGDKTGTLILKLNDFNLEDKVLVRSDGTAVYTARDMAYQLWKFGHAGRGLKFKLWPKSAGGKIWTTNPTGKPSAKFGHADVVINVVGAEQRFPQQVVFTGLKALKLEKEYRNSHHLAYEHVWLPSGRFSGRKGTWVGFSVDDVLEEAVTRSKIVVKEHAPDAGEKFWKAAAEFVGVGAIRYSLLSMSPDKRITFKWEESLNFDRNSGPAIQYSHARACNILKKARSKGGKHPDDTFKLPQELRLVKLLSMFPDVVKESGEKLQPHMLALYAAELALAFNTFYEAAPVVKAETAELKAARLRLVNCVRIVLGNALKLMGIVAPERM